MLFTPTVVRQVCRAAAPAKVVPAAYLMVNVLPTRKRVATVTGAPFSTRTGARAANHGDPGAVALQLAASTFGGPLNLACSGAAR